MNRVLKLIRIEDVVQKTTLAKSTIWLKIAQGLLNYPDGVDLDVFRDWKAALQK